MTPDNELLRRYAETKSEEAFAELVRRHVNIVYSAALRRLNGDPHLAQDAAQMVFSGLARKASALSRRTTLTGWLYTSAHFAAAEIARKETRRRCREESFMRETISTNVPEPDWERLRPVLDDVMLELKAADREAILLRYFENLPLAQIGGKLGLSENTARMRVDRTLEKIRGLLAKRGIATTEALAAAISAHAVQAAPAGMAATLATNSVALAGSGAFTLLKIMTATQLKLGLGALAVACLATGLVVQYQTNGRLESENAALNQQMARMKTEEESLSNQLAVASGPKSPSDSQHTELMRLRGEVGMLGEQLRQRQAAPAMGIAAAQPAAEEDPVEDQQMKTRLVKMSDGKVLAMAEMMFAQANQGQLATNYDQIVPYLAGSQPALSGSNTYELVYRGSMNGLTNPAFAILMREAEPWPTGNGQWAKSYVFADGHSEIHVEPSDNFDDFEQPRTPLPPPAQ